LENSKTTQNQIQHINQDNKGEKSRCNTKFYKNKLALNFAFGLLHLPIQNFMNKRGGLIRLSPHKAVGGGLIRLWHSLSPPRR
jgi:hypothetical protein